MSEYVGLKRYCMARHKSYQKRFQIIGKRGCKSQLSGAVTWGRKFGINTDGFTRLPFQRNLFRVNL